MYDAKVAQTNYRIILIVVFETKRYKYMNSLLHSCRTQTQRLVLPTTINYPMKSQNLLKLAEEFGAPLYVYDAEKIASQYRRLTKAFEGVPSLRLNYAAKALSNISVLRFMNHLGGGLDTVSIEEVKLGLMAGFKPESIIYTPNGVSLEEIEEAAALGVQYEYR